MPKRSCVVAVLAVLAGCQVTPPAPQPEPPSLQLLASEPMVLAPGCDVTGTGSLFVQFTVRTDGRTDVLELPSAPACVREALTAWVSSFRYLPPTAEVPTGIEWLLVSARRGS